MENNTKALLLALVERFEGFYPRPYLCPAGVCTIGFGTTIYPSGRRVTLSDQSITREQGYAYAWHELRNCLKQAVANSPVLAEDHSRLAAIADFCYNLGAGAYRGSTLRKRINEEDWLAARAQIMRWNKAGGRVLRGLTLRRQSEAALL